MPDLWTGVQIPYQLFRIVDRFVSPSLLDTLTYFYSAGFAYCCASREMLRDCPPWSEPSLFSPLLQAWAVVAGEVKPSVLVMLLVARVHGTVDSEAVADTA